MTDRIVSLPEMLGSPVAGPLMALESIFRPVPIGLIPLLVVVVVRRGRVRAAPSREPRAATTDRIHRPIPRTGPGGAGRLGG